MNIELKDEEQRECIYCDHIHTEEEPCLKYHCICKKCGDIILCDHKPDYGHEISLCGACIF